MDWISSFGRRFAQAYSEGLAMSCPVYRCSQDMPAAIDQRQDNVRVARSGTQPLKH